MCNMCKKRMANFSNKHNIRIEVVSFNIFGKSRNTNRDINVNSNVTIVFE